MIGTKLNLDWDKWVRLGTLKVKQCQQKVMPASWKFHDNWKAGWPKCFDKNL